MKLFWCLSVLVLASPLLASARHVNHNQVNAASYDHSHQQTRGFPGVLTVKKLILLKFKKIIPISLILLRSGNENEAELVPVYPTSEIPSDVQFIPTPNGITGHKDVQAIAIPNEFHQEVELQDLNNMAGGIESSLIAQLEDNKDNESSLDVAAPTNKDENDELLNVREEDEDQLLETPATEKPLTKSSSSTRRLPVDNTKSHIQTQTAIEEIPIYLYSTNDKAHVIRHQIGARRNRRKP